jgi:hypothetical protein
VLVVPWSIAATYLAITFIKVSLSRWKLLIYYPNLARGRRI